MPKAREAFVVLFSKLWMYPSRQTLHTLFTANFSRRVPTQSNSILPPFISNWKDINHYSNFAFLGNVVLWKEIWTLPFYAFEVWKQKWIFGNRATRTSSTTWPVQLFSLWFFQQFKSFWFQGKEMSILDRGIHTKMFLFNNLAKLFDFLFMCVKKDA